MRANFIFPLLVLYFLVGLTCCTEDLKKTICKPAVINTITQATDTTALISFSEPDTDDTPNYSVTAMAWGLAMFVNMDVNPPQASFNLLQLYPLTLNTHLTCCDTSVSILVPVNCAPPTNLQVVAPLGSTTAEISWDAAPNAIFYTITLTNLTTGVETVVETELLTVSVPVEPDDPYVVEIYTNCTDGSESSIETTTFRTATDSIPTIVDIQRINGANVWAGFIATNFDTPRTITIPLNIKDSGCSAISLSNYTIITYQGGSNTSAKPLNTIKGQFNCTQPHELKTTLGAGQHVVLIELYP